MPNFFLHYPSGRSWPTDDPHRWLLDHPNDEVVAARERLVLSADDPERCLRAAVRRCGLVLIQVISDVQVGVRHLSDPTPDPKQWAKEHGFNRSGVQVTFINAKNGKVVIHRDGEALLVFGERVGPGFPWPEYAARYEHRDIEETDDADAAPATYANFVWASVPHERLTWRVLKSVWRTERVKCQNYDHPLVLIGFEWHQGPLSSRSGRVFRHCLGCQRRLEVHESEPLRWLASVLPPVLRPSYLDQWRRFEIDWTRLSFKHQRPVQVEDREE